MNQNLGLICKKLGNTQIFNEDGTVSRVTALQAGPCRVLSKRTQEQHGYSALQLGFGQKREKLVSKPEAGYFGKLEQSPAQVVQELRLPAEVVAGYEVGQELKVAEIFQVGQMVDVTGTSKGRGFTGVMKRHNFAGAGTVGHGTHEYKRHGGSIGTNMTPGRTLKNVKMPGQYGNKRITTQNIRVAGVLEDEGIVLLEGSVPGSKRGIVTVRGAIKTKRAAD